jgi:hypothetical protein
MNNKLLNGDKPACNVQQRNSSGKLKGENHNSSDLLTGAEVAV